VVYPHSGDSSSENKHNAICRHGLALGSTFHLHSILLLRECSPFEKISNLLLLLFPGVQDGIRRAKKNSGHESGLPAILVCEDDNGRRRKEFKTFHHHWDHDSELRQLRVDSCASNCHSIRSDLRSLHVWAPLLFMFLVQHCFRDDCRCSEKKIHRP
jgi:hypothetical protein